jgi:hypothetical protein
MKKVLFIGLLFGFISCENDQSADQTESQKKVQTDSQKSVNEPIEQAPLNKDSLVKNLDQYRSVIESSVDTPIEISSSELRAKTKQKWQKLHFYALNGEVVRIKTYPYPETSDRTEEFYLKDNQLVLAVIEDHGNGERGKLKNEIDKLYYFSDGEVIQEHAHDIESEFSVRNSDGEELLSEVNEYLKIYKENPANTSK